MRVSIKDLEKAIAYIRKNSGDEHLIINMCEQFGQSNDTLVVEFSDLSKKIMEITIYDENTKKVATILKTETL